MKKTKVFASLLAASLAAVSLSFANPAGAVADSPSNEKTYRVKINKVDSDGAQLTNAQFNIVKGNSADGEVVDTFTSTDEAYYAELPEGTYTLVETQAPAGYTVAAPQTFTVEKPAAWTDPTIGDHYRATTKSSWYSYEYTVTTNVTTGGAVNEVVYCVNLNKSSPAHNSDYIKRDGSADVLVAATSTTTRHQDGDALRSKLMSIVYNGYPTNASGFQGSLSDAQFRAVTQQAVWDTVNKQNVSRYQRQPQMRDAYNNLMRYTQNVPENLEAHMYQVSTDQANKYQSLLGTTFGEIAAPMEITVVNEKVTSTDVVFSKTEVEGSEELPGASLEVRNEQGDALESWVSTETPHVFALTPGTYSMHESQAPEGYDVAEDITFRVTNDFRVEIKNGEEWVAAENSTVKMEDKLTPVTYGGELDTTPTPEEEKPNLPNTGSKDVLANTGAKIVLPAVAALLMLAVGVGALLYRRKKNS